MDEVQELVDSPLGIKIVQSRYVHTSRYHNLLYRLKSPDTYQNKVMTLV